MNSHLKTAEYLANLLDNKYGVGKFRFGLDPLLGFFPIAGDVFAAALSFYIIWIAIDMKLPQDKIVQMIKNVLIDFSLDFIPVVGQIADFAFKANIKNLEILKKYAPVDIIEGQTI